MDLGELLRSERAVAVRCPWMFTGQRPLVPGLLTVFQGRIVAVGRNDSPAPPLDIGPWILLPPLVNPHTHLEFGDLREPLGGPGMPLPTWIGEVVARRRATLAATGEAGRRAAIQTGLRESASAGVRLLGDIATTPWRADWIGGQGVELVAFRELLSLDVAAAAEVLEQARRHFDDPSLAGAGIAPGLSPHAPYTTTRDVVEGAIEIARDRAGPVALHLAESPEEVELLRTGEGPFRELLSAAGVWRGAEVYAGRSIAWHLEQLAAAPRALLIHGNYLNAAEMRQAGCCADRVSIVYCPRTHAYFQHAPYPLAELLRCGAEVVLGTDSRASSPNLDVLSEWRCAAARHAEVDPLRLLEMVTWRAAAALGKPAGWGRIQEGAAALLTAVPLAETSAPRVLDALLQGGAPIPWESLTI